MKRGWLGFIDPGLGLLCSGLSLQLLAASHTPPQRQSQPQPQIIGEAFDLKTRELLYREFHQDNPVNHTRTIFYRDSRNHLLAEKELDYKTGCLTPSYSQTNFNQDYRLGVKIVPQNIIFRQQTLGKAATTEKIPQKKPLIIDAGFDPFIRQQWDNLEKGEVMHFYFPLATREQLVKLQIRQQPCSYQNSGHRCFSLQVDNGFLRLFSDPIELGYDQAHKRLQRYRGLSNIEDAQGRGLKVDIHYRYEGKKTQC